MRVTNVHMEVATSCISLRIWPSPVSGDVKVRHVLLEVAPASQSTWGRSPSHNAPLNQLDVLSLRDASSHFRSGARSYS